MAIWSFIKSKRAQSADDFETWVGGGEIIPTLNAFDVGDGREVVVIIQEPIILQEREGKAGGGKGFLMSDKSFSLRTSNFQTLFHKEEVYTIQIGGIGDKSTMSYQEEKSYCLPANPMSDRVQTLSHGLTVRRLTPKECERLQGFPDDWTAGQADSSRYKQMGNAVAVPVVNWIIERMVRDE